VRASPNSLFVESGKSIQAINTPGPFNSLSQDKNSAQSPLTFSNASLEVKMIGFVVLPVAKF
jgi:hypothetical protein